MKKQDVMELMHDMPDEIDIEELMRRIDVLAKIQKSEASIAKDGLIPDEKLDEQRKEWGD